MSSMLDALTGGGGGPPGPPPGGPAPYNLDQGPPAADDQGGGTPHDQVFDNSLDALDMAEEALHAFIRMDPDEIDRAQAGQALNVVLKLKASNQKSNQAGDAKSLMRTLGGGGGGPPGLGG